MRAVLLLVLAVVCVLLVAAGAWAGVAMLVSTVSPEGSLAVLALYAFLFPAIAATAALLAWVALRPRTAEGALKPPSALLGHTALLAVIAEFGLWLQSLRMLSPIVVALLVGLYVSLELALLFGTRGAVERDAHRQGPLGYADP